MSQGTQRGAKSFELAEHVGEVAETLNVADLDSCVNSLVNPVSTSETLHWGRNYLYGAVIAMESGSVDVVVKQFRNQGPKRRMDRRFKGSKAERSWLIALALQAAQVATPEPLLWIESRHPEGPSFFVSRRLENFLEARYYFRALEAGTEKEDFPEWDAKLLIGDVGRAIRRLHNAGIWHRDMSIGNILLQADRNGGEPGIFFIDLNRARQRRRLSTLHRTRDLCRLRIFRSDLQEEFLLAYWGAETRGLWRKRFLYRVAFRGFLFKVWAKGAIRRPFRGLRDWLRPRHAHVHIPKAPKEASARDRAVWDSLSDQPHQHATRMQRLAVRIGDAPIHVREMAAGLGAIPKIRRRYLGLKSSLYSRPIEWSGMGIALRPWKDNPEALLRALQELGSKRAILRLHPWQQQHTAEEELAKELHRQGYELSFVLPQNRDLVRDLDRWRASVTELAERFGKFGRHFQIGQAINRSKWGVWNLREYLDLAGAAAEVLRQDPERLLLGPAVIDYEPLRTAGILNTPQDQVTFDILSSLLYVDRRGAPENTQLGFDTVDKITQMKAIADTSPNCGDRSWITEVNWPLWEGPHSPAGRNVSVDEETQANYLARFYLLALGTGLAERVYWWQLVARGYGLGFEASDGGLQLRPSFAAFVTLQRLLEGARFLGPLKSPSGVRLYHFRTDDNAEWVAGWSAEDIPAQADLPRPSRFALTREGQELTLSGDRVEIDAAPRYFRLDPE